MFIDKSYRKMKKLKKEYNAWVVIRKTWFLKNGKTVDDFLVITNDEYIIVDNYEVIKCDIKDLLLYYKDIERGIKELEAAGDKRASKLKILLNKIESKCDVIEF